MFCSKCGKDMPDDSAFCPACATPTGIASNAEVTPFAPVQAPPQNTPPKKKMKKGCLIVLLIPVGLAVIFTLYIIGSVILDPDTETTTSAQTTAVTTSVAVVETTTQQTATTQQITTKAPVTTEAPKTEPPKTTKAPAQIIKISAGDLISAYAEDEANADKLYKGKILEVIGTIEVLGYDSNPPEIDISDGNPMASYLVMCLITPGSVDKAAALNPGSAVTVVGTCSGFDSDYMNIVLENSYIK